MSRSPRLTLLASALALSALGPAHAASITREFTAAWYDPSRPGHGLGLEVIDAGGAKNALVYWFTYDKAGRQLWLFGTAPVQDDRVSMTVYSTSGGAFDNSFTPGQVRTTAWGTLTLKFDDCNTGRLSFDPADPALPAGSMPLVRSTRLFNGTCSGGLSDDLPSSADELERVQFLTNRGRFPAASAKAKFEQRPGRSEFSVEIEDAPAGDYSLRVDGTERGSIRVAASARGTEGELEFRSPVEPGKILLDFDPRGAAIEISDAGGLVFSGLFDDTGAGGGGGGGSTPPPASGGVERGSAIYEIVVEPSGNDGPELHAELEQRSDRVEFSVELEDLPVAEYSLRVAGSLRGTIAVVNVAGGTEGEIEFRDPVEPGKQLLDFDPRGQRIQIERDGSVVISAQFPSTPTGDIEDDNGGDDNGSGGNDDGGGDDNGGGGNDDGGGDDNGGGGNDDGGGDDNGGGGNDDGGGDDNGGGGGGGGTPAPGTVSAALVSTGVDADAHGTATYEATANEREFEVEVEDLPDGDYVLMVGGTRRGSLQVEDEEGEIKFNDPARPGRALLDFDPRGQLIEVERNGVVYVRGTLR